MARVESAGVERPNKARNRDRTDDLILTKDVLYRLSYASIPDARSARGKSVKVSGAGVGLKGGGTGRTDPPASAPLIRSQSGAIQAPRELDRTRQ